MLKSVPADFTLLAKEERVTSRKTSETILPALCGLFADMSKRNETTHSYNLKVYENVTIQFSLPSAIGEFFLFHFWLSKYDNIF